MRRIPSAARAATLIAAAAALAGCPSSEPCPLESPQVSAIPGACTEVAGQPVTYPVRLCPTCNQTGASCVVDLSAVGAGSGDIFLDTKVEACTGSGSCPPSCAVNAISCTFNAPATPGTYNVIALDGATGQPVESVLFVVAPGTPESCALAAGPAVPL